MSKFAKNPVTKIVLMYAIFILIGTVMLQMNIFIKPGQDVDFLQSFFTSNSAFATTGLTLFDYTEVYNNFGCLLLVIFFNIGGMGIMTLNTILFVLIGKKIGFQNRVLAKIDLNRDTTDGFIKLAKAIIVIFLSVELVGAILIFMSIGYMDFGFWDRIMASLFMASSAITGSGFFNTIPYATNYFVLFVLIILMIFSFIGYPAIFDILAFIKHKVKREEYRYRFSNFTKISVMVNVFTLLLFAFLFLALEYNNTMIDNTWFERIYYSIYISTSTKSVGLTVFPDITLFRPMTLTFSIIFMIIGGAPSSACGGIRVSTVYVIYIYIKSQLKNKKQAIYGSNFVSESTILKAYNVTFLFLLLSFIGFIMILLFNTDINTFYLWYDVISAITTTGFSTGALASVNSFGVLVIAILMFIGRIGVINLITAMNFRKRQYSRVGFIEKDIII